jgi:hypothetical protein
MTYMDFVVIPRRRAGSGGSRRYRWPKGGGQRHAVERSLRLRSGRPHGQKAAAARQLRFAMAPLRRLP